MNVKDLNEVLAGKTIKSVEPTPNRPGSVTINFEGGEIPSDEKLYMTASCVHELFMLHYRGVQKRDWALIDERRCRRDDRPAHKAGLCYHCYKQEASQVKAYWDLINSEQFKNMEDLGDPNAQLKPSCQFEYDDPDTGDLVGRCNRWVVKGGYCEDHQPVTAENIGDLLESFRTSRATEEL
jgi:hypothetical protein